MGAYFCRQSYKQGGVSVFVSKDIQFYAITLKKYVKEKDFEICAIQLQVPLTNLLVICFYKSPMGDFNYVLNQLELVLNHYAKYLPI